MRMIHSAKLLALFATALVAFAAMPVHADVMYGLDTVTDASSQTPGVVTRRLEFVEYSNGTDIRVENSSSLDGPPRIYDTITDSAHNQMLRFDPALKLFTREPLDTTKPGIFAVVSQILADRDRAKVHASASRIGTETLTYIIKDLAPETVNGQQTKHFAVNLARQTTGCLGATTHNIRLEIWATDDGGISVPPMASSVDTVNVNTGSTYKVTRKVIGDVPKLQAIFGMQPIQIKIVTDNAYDYALTLGQFEHSSEQLDTALFSPSSDLQEVPPAQFAAAERQFAHKQLLAAQGNPQAPRSASQRTSSPVNAVPTPSQNNGNGNANDDSDIPTAPPPRHRVVMPGLPGGINIP